MTGAEHEKYNRDELVPPSWLTEKYIRDLLVSMEKDPQLVVNIKTVIIFEK